MNALRLAVLLGVLLLAVPFGSANAQPVPVPETYGGDLLSRPKLTGNWGASRFQMMLGFRRIEPLAFYVSLTKDQHIVSVDFEVVHQAWLPRLFG